MVATVEKNAYKKTVAGVVCVRFVNWKAKIQVHFKFCSFLLKNKVGDDEILERESQWGYQ